MSAFGRWRKSSRSNGDANDCVEVAWAAAVVGMRDSKNTDGPVLVLDESGWAAFRRSITRA